MMQPQSFCIPQSKMNIFILLLNIVFITVISSVTDEEWNKYKTEYRKTYRPKVDQIRRKIYEKNVHLLDTHNRRYQQGLETWYMKINEYSDFPEIKTEWPATVNESKNLEESETRSSLEQFPFPNQPTTRLIKRAHDWTQESFFLSDVIPFIPPPQDEGPFCPSYWAFAAVFLYEIAYRVQNGIYVKFSEQELIDCAYDGDLNTGCSRHEIHSALRDIDISKIHTAVDYPRIKSGGCRCKRNDPDFPPVVNVLERWTYRKWTPNSDEMQTIEMNFRKFLFEKHLAIGVTLEVTKGLQQYSSGVLNRPCTPAPNTFHPYGRIFGVITGWGTMSQNGSDIKYWSVRMSRGESYGYNGYIRVLRDQNVNALCIYNIITRIFL